MCVFYGTGLGVYTCAIQQWISGQWEPIAYVEDFEMAADILAGMDDRYFMPEFPRFYRIVFD